jgi:hypothetical protein
LGYHKYFGKPFSEMSYHVESFMAFKPKWVRSWPNPYDSLFKWLHIMHMCATWDDKQCSFQVFSFSSHKKFIFYFPIVKNGVFCEGSTKYLILNNTTRILLYNIWYFMHKSPTIWVSNDFHISFMKKSNLCWISWKLVKFELQVPHSMFMIFFKNHF